MVGSGTTSSFLGRAKSSSRVPGLSTPFREMPTKFLLIARMWSNRGSNHNQNSAALAWPTNSASKNAKSRNAHSEDACLMATEAFRSPTAARFLRRQIFHWILPSSFSSSRCASFSGKERIICVKFWHEGRPTVLKSNFLFFQHHFDVLRLLPTRIEKSEAQARENHQVWCPSSSPRKPSAQKAGSCQRPYPATVFLHGSRSSSLMLPNSKLASFIKCRNKSISLNGFLSRTSWNVADW